VTNTGSWQSQNHEFWHVHRRGTHQQNKKMLDTIIMKPTHQCGYPIDDGSTKERQSKRFTNAIRVVPIHMPRTSKLGALDDHGESSTAASTITPDHSPLTPPKTALVVSENLPPLPSFLTHHHEGHAEDAPVMKTCAAWAVEGSAKPGIVVRKTAKSRPPKKLEVSFSTIEIRRYPMIIGDNPACRIGPPVSLGWGYEALPELTIDDFERLRSKQRRTRLHHLVLNYYQRLEIVQHCGVTREERKKVERQVARIQRQRGITAIFSPLEPVERMAQSAGRKVRRYFHPQEARISDKGPSPRREGCGFRRQIIL
jgi:hypothetical protein